MNNIFRIVIGDPMNVYSIERVFKTNKPIDFFIGENGFGIAQGFNDWVKENDPWLNEKMEEYCILEYQYYYGDSLTKI